VSGYRIDGREAEPSEFVARALDPRRSCVVEACAGSGKTWLLVGRIVRLLLAGQPASSILAITFTRRAAREMRERLFDLLGELAIAPQERVLELLQERGLDAPAAASLVPVARTLHERVVASSAPVTIETFHGWFARLLRAAPLEEGGAVSPVLLEDESAQLEEAWVRFCQFLASPGGARERRAFEALATQIGDGNAEALLIAFLRRRAAWWSFALADPADAVERACAPMREALRAACGRDDLPPSQSLLDPAAQAPFRAILALWRAPGVGAKSVAQAADQLEQWLEQLAAGRSPAVTDLALVFCTKEGDPRQRLEPAALARGLDPVAGRRQAYERLWRELLERVRVLGDAQLEWDALLLNRNGLTCGKRLLEIYQESKRSAHLVDHSDQEWQASRLLGDPGVAAYLQEWLDVRYRHILLDEFQDTSPLQWQILRNWLGAYEDDARKPLVFLVGDRKQSIYRFRDAEPAIFDEAGRRFQEEFDASILRTNVTWRNPREVVQACNAVFGSGGNPLYEHHETTVGHAGVVRILEPIERAPEPEAAPDGLRDSLARARPSRVRDERAREGERIAREITALRARLSVPGQGGAAARAARWSDVLILLASRTHAHEIESALREAGIPFRSARRGELLEQLEVQDLLAMLSFLDDPEDDLVLAHCLRSPAFGCTGADLERLVGGAGWWPRLVAMADPGERLARARDLLQRWRPLAGVLPVHDLLDRIVHESRAREAYGRTVPAPLHSQVQSNLDALLALALELEAGRFPSLPRFLESVAGTRDRSARRGSVEGVEEGDPSSEDAVQMLTIHGAKGLEAPIVVLADTDPAGDRLDHYGCLVSWPAASSAPVHFSLVGSRAAAGGSRSAWIEADAAQDAQESWNLLYVAMTRARQALLVSSVEPHRSAPGTAWSRIAAAGLPLAAPCELLPGRPDGATIRLVHDFAPASLSAGRRRDDAGTLAMRLGSAWHALLQRGALPRDRGAVRSIRREFGLDAPSWRLVEEAFTRVRTDARLAVFFAPGAAGEDELEVLDAEGATLRIDRLVEVAGTAWVLDYKWTLAPELLPQYERQVRRYLRALAGAGVSLPLRGLLVSAEPATHEVALADAAADAAADDSADGC